jgi:hypothetical protein
MTDDLPYTPELLAKVWAALAEDGVGRAPADSALVEEMAAALHAGGIALVDRARERCLIDETVYQGALYRSGLFRQRVERLEAQATHRLPGTGVWRRLSQPGETT